jgi:hypothetical protein
MELPDAVMKTVMDVVTLKAVVFTLLYNIRLLTVNGHDMNKRRKTKYFN